MKLIALDLDGTLINRDSSISERTRQYLQHLADSGRWILWSQAGHMKKARLDGAKRSRLPVGFRTTSSVKNGISIPSLIKTTTNHGNPATASFSLLN